MSETIGNALDPAVAMELADIREKIENAKKVISDFVDGKDEAINTRTDDLENATCEQSVTVESRLADIETALCDLSEQIVTARATA